MTTRGSIITFYSYKGGVGRSMMVANVAWLLASNGKRVLAADWDLEAPGLHRYFSPFLDERRLASCPGVLDLLIDHADSAQHTESQVPTIGTARLSHVGPSIENYTVPLEWDFPKNGVLDLMPAGRPNPAYATRLTSFSWESFYSKFDGRAFLEELKTSLTRQYDYVLIDSRTGVSDVAGICTVQMPDTLVVLFSYNRQSIEGTARVAWSVDSQRGEALATDESRIKIIPVPTRVEPSELQKLDAARDHVRTEFSQFFWYLPDSERDHFWRSVEVYSYPLYSYGELLCTFGDQSGKPGTMLATIERICGHLTSGAVSQMPPLPEARRQTVISGFAQHAKTPLTNPKCFISHSSKDRSFAERLRADLQERGFVCWYAPHDLPIGARIRSGIEDALQTHDKVVLILSSHAINSTWVEAEVETTLEREVASGNVLLIPIRLDTAIMSTNTPWAANIRRQRNIGDFSAWPESGGYEAALAKLVVSLNA